MPDLLTAFALIAIVLLVSALASGVVERAPLSFPIIFLGLGVLLGERGLGLIALDTHDPTLEAIAILSLAFVLFLDAVRLRFDEGWRSWLVPALVLGPGTLLVIGIVAFAAARLLGLGVIPALLLGAILSSTDPVVLRDVVRDERVPGAVRRVLTLEAGMNDIVVLPIVLVLAAIATAEVGGAADWTLFIAQIFVLGPLVGFAIGGLGSWLMARIDARMAIRREYQALYGVGLVLAAYVGGTAVGGDGFLAAFAAGVAVVILDNELCECFLEYGETTAEMAMLLAFVLFGAVLSTTLGSVPLLATLALAAIVIFVARPLAISLVLTRAALSPRARAFIGWFGPRGLNSLLFALLLVRDGVPEAERLLALVGLVVFVSVVAHGTSATPLATLYGRGMARETLAEEREGTVEGLFEQAPTPNEVARVAPEELARRLAGTDPPLVLDVRSRSEWARDRLQIPGSVRVLPDHIAEWAASRPDRPPIVTYCT
ncbi:MAG: cation:proton antiporter [Chloroflexota bacterium]|nr:cation:proton antiporter [Chloroflexota bacterium]